MARYLVTLLYDCAENVEVEAADVEAAREAAHAKAKGSLCHYCARHLELGDVTKALVFDDEGNELDADEDAA